MSAGPDRNGLPQSGNVLHVTRAASVQFVDAIYFRVIRVHDWTTYQGWIWVDGYELDARGEAVERRSIFVQPAGLRWLPPAPPARPAGRGPMPVNGRWARTPV